MISAQMNTHDRLIRNANARTENYLSKFCEHQMEYNRKLEKWRPSYNELQEKAREDEILADLISSATARCETELDHHIKRFKKNRARNPGYKPGWLESYVNGKNMAVHEELLRKAGPRIDNGPPQKAIQFRDFLRSCKYTKGGFLRPSKQRRPRNANGAYGLGDSRSVSAPPYPGHPQGVPVDACGREKKLNPALVSKYSELVFQKHMDNATNDDVRVMYAQNNDQQIKLPPMGDFVAQQGVNMREVETDMAATYEMYIEGDNVSPYGLGTVREGEYEGEYEYEEEEEAHDHRAARQQGPQTESQAKASEESQVESQDDGIAMHVSSQADTHNVSF